jgi:hypothetical protein
MVLINIVLNMIEKKRECTANLKISSKDLRVCLPCALGNRSMKYYEKFEHHTTGKIYLGIVDFNIDKGVISGTKMCGWASKMHRGFFQSLGEINLRQTRPILHIILNRTDCTFLNEMYVCLKRLG